MALDKNTIEQINIRSEFFQDILDKVPSRIITYGAMGMTIVFIMICLGMKLIKYPDVVNAEVVITTETPSIEVHSKTSGRITEIFKKDQESVNAREWVVLLNNSAKYKDILETTDKLQKIDSNSFWPSLDKIQFYDLTNLGDLQEPYSSFIKSINELALFNNSNYQTKQLEINLKRENNYEEAKKEYNRQLQIAERQLEIAKIDYDRNEILLKGNVIAKSELEQKEIALLNNKNKLEELNSSLINTQIQIELLKKDNESLINDKSNSNFNLRRNVVQSYNKLLYELSEWKNKYVLEAPTSGRLNFYEIRTPNQFITNEQKVFTISPINLNNYFAIAKLPISNSGKVKIGQECLVKLNNFPFTEFGIIKGKIESITSAAKEGFYSVKIELPAQLMTNSHKQLFPKGELIGEADIVVDDLTLFDRIFKSLVNKNY